MKKRENDIQREEEDFKYKKSIEETFQKPGPITSTPVKVELEADTPQIQKGLDNNINQSYLASGYSLNSRTEILSEEEEEGNFSPVATRTRSNIQGKRKYSYAGEEDDGFQ